ncbi:MAG: RagB/SusD family nutrient uptake outer membrane protein [Syntrophomonadaceae bacterium]|nr:RagB/SusD family nutrient uptake outer membrane protein [Syntrophomonadaceae bacterium]
MKKIFSIIIYLIVFGGCSESFLDKLPEDTLSPGTFFQTTADIKTGVVAAYQPLQSLFAYNQLPHVLGQMSDDGTRAFSITVYHTFEKNNTHSNSAFWNNFYKIIVNANNIIAIIDAFEVKPGDETEINALRGEASFMRALAYFYLVRLYGDVPMVSDRFDDPGTAFGMGRTKVNDILTQVVIPDLEFAFANCYKKGDAAISGEEGRATKGAALTILGKVYLTMNNHAKAAETLKKLIVDKAAGNYALLDDFSQIWLPSNKHNAESIFEVGNSVDAGSPSYYFRNMTTTTGYSIYDLATPNGSYTITKDCMDTFYANEEWIRYAVSADSAWTPLNGLHQPFPLKLMPPLEGISKYDQVGTDYNYMITRYADALLMYAEALMVTGQKQEAANYINQVRARVDMAPVSADDLNIDRILHERRMELAFEGHRYFDLVRTGKAIEYLSANLMSNVDYEIRVFRTTPVPEYQLLLPIPVGEIEIDPTLTQNPGY